MVTIVGEIAGLAAANVGRLLDAVPDPMIVTDVDGVIFRASRSASTLLGYPATHLRGRRLAELVCADLQPDYEAHRAGFVSSGAETGPELETRLRTATGLVIPVDASVGRLDVDGRTFLLLVLREVSDRLATQNRLERMIAIDDLTTSISSRLNTPDPDTIDQSIAAAIDELASFYDAGTFLYTRDQPGRFVVHSRARADDAGLTSLGLEELQWVSSLLDGGSITEVRTEGPVPPEAVGDCLRLREAGVISLVLIPLRASGRTIGFAGIESGDPRREELAGEDLVGLLVVQDVFENALERKRVGFALQRANRILQAVSECHDALIRAHDEKELLRDVCRIVVEAGRYALAWVGYPMDDDSKGIDPQAHWGEGEDYVSNLQLTWSDEGAGRGPAGTAIRTRRPTVVQDTSASPEITWHLRPHQQGFLSLVTVPMFYGDEVAGVLAVYDRQPGAFTEQGVKVLQRFADDLAYGIAALRARARQREAESQLRELLESKDEMIATIAHELRTPLAGVVGFANVLRDQAELLDAESRAEMIRLVAEQGMDLTNIVDDLLVAAKSEAGTLEVASVRVDLRANAAQVLEGWGSDAVRSVAFTGEPAITTGDPARVRQILRNLVTNALRYGGEQISVRVGGGERTVFVTVEDNGPGVAPEEQEKIFEPYRRAHDAPGVTASMGLGLSISRHLARMMGGDLVYRRQSGSSLFTLSMPTRSEP